VLTTCTTRGSERLQLAANVATSAEMLEDFYGKKRMRDLRRGLQSMVLPFVQSGLGLPGKTIFRPTSRGHLTAGYETLAVAGFARFGNSP
jgi:hypothetical protein